MGKSTRAKTRTSIYKRNKKCIELLRTLYSNDFIAHMPEGLLEQKLVSYEQAGILPMDITTSSSCGVFGGVKLVERDNSSISDSNENDDNDIVDNQCDDDESDGNLNINGEGNYDVDNSSNNSNDSGDSSDDRDDNCNENGTDDDNDDGDDDISNEGANGISNDGDDDDDNGNDDGGNITNDDNDDINNDCDNDGSSDNGNNANNRAVKGFVDTLGAIFNLPVIPKSNIYQGDYLLSAIAISVRHNLSYEATLSILKWLKMSHASCKLPTTKQSLWKALNRDDNSIVRHLYCSICQAYLGTHEKPNRHCPCGACGPTIKNSKFHYFIQLDLFDEISEFLKIPNISKLLEYRTTRTKSNPDAIEDVYDGEMYKKLCSRGNFLNNPDNFSFTLSTDGCRAAESSGASAWPVYLQVNELPPHMRKKHMLLAGLFVDVMHPSINSVLRPIIDQLKNLYENGIEWKSSQTETRKSHFIVIMCSVDSPARSMIMRTTQFNGYYGCSFCYAKGEYNLKMTYPLSQNTEPLRTDTELRTDMILAFQTKGSVRGVKGISSLAALPGFDLSKGIVVESMHAVFLGVVKQHTKLLIKTKKKKMELIDERLLSIKPHNQRSRTPRTIFKHNLWKASEWRNWLDYALSCLDGIFANKYVEHIALLSQAVHYLNNSSLTSRELAMSQVLLKKYVILFEKYFGEENMSFNVHILLHLTDTVRNWGPIWCHSAFTFESWNKKIIDKITGPNRRADQIVMRFLMTQFIERSIWKDNVSKEVKDFTCKLLKISDIMETNTRQKIDLLGRGQKRSLKEKEKKCIEQAGYTTPVEIICFKKMKINSIKYSTKNNKQLKNCNSVISSAIYGFGQIVNIVCFIYNDRVIHGMFINCFIEKEKMYNTQYIVQIQSSKKLIFAKFPSDIRPAVEVCTENGSNIFKLANCWETD